MPKYSLEAISLAGKVTEEGPLTLLEAYVFASQLLEQGGCTITLTDLDTGVTTTSVENLFPYPM